MSREFGLLSYVLLCNGGATLFLALASNLVRCLETGEKRKCQERVLKMSLMTLADILGGSCASHYLRMHKGFLSAALPHAGWLSCRLQLHRQYFPL